MKKKTYHGFTSSSIEVNRKGEKRKIKWINDRHTCIYGREAEDLPLGVAKYKDQKMKLYAYKKLIQ